MNRGLSFAGASGLSGPSTNAAEDLIGEAVWFDSHGVEVERQALRQRP